LLSGYSQITIWNEDFTGYGNLVVVGQDNNLPVGADWTTTATDCDGGGAIVGANWIGADWWGTTVGGQFRVTDIEGGPCTCGTGGTTDNFFTTEPINISGFFNVGFTINISSSGSMEAGPLSTCDNSGDNLRVSYSLNGAPFIQAATNGLLSGNFVPNPTTVSQACLNGNTLVIRIQAGNKANDESYFIDNINVTGFNTPLIANAGIDDTICPGDNIILNASGGGTYTWNSSPSLSCTNCQNPTATPGSTQSYILTVDQGGCNDADTVTITVGSPLININLGNDTVVCGGPINILLDATQPGSTNYLWQNLSTNTTFNVTTAGTYFVQASNLCNSDEDTIVVQLNNVPLVNLGNDTAICPGIINFNLDATTTGVNYVWQDFSTTPVYNVTSTGIYFVTVSNICGTHTDTVNVTLLNNPSVNLGNDTIVCGGPINIILNAFNPASTYQWQDMSTLSTYNVNTAGQYFVVVTNSCGSVTDTINIQLLNIPVANLGNDTAICAGAINLILDQTQPNVNYLWQNMSTNATFNVTNAGTYIVSVSNVCGIEVDSIIITELQLPFVDLGNDTLVCSSPINILLNAFNVSSTYLWQNGSTNNNFNVNNPGVYFVTVTNNCGSYTDSIRINEGTIAQVNLGNDQLLCNGDSIQLDISINNAINYLWQDGNTLPIYYITTPGTYIASASTLCNTDVDTIEIFPQIQVQNFLTEFIADCYEDSMFIDLSQNYPGISGVWSNGDIGPSTFITTTGEHYVSFTYCNTLYTDSFNVLLMDTVKEEIFIPNAFTPNLDEVNPVYKIFGSFTKTSSFSAVIFNRWGEEVFSTNDPDFIWDGTYKGKQAPVGAYYMQVEMTKVCDPTTYQLGSVINLIR